jgi:hypothetical protein
MSISSTPGAASQQMAGSDGRERVGDTTETVFIDTWSDKIDAMLLILRENCNYMSKYHNYKYQLYKERLKWFRIPIIVMSAINAFTAVGLQAYMAQKNISTINSILSLLCGILTSVELFLNIQKKMENDLTSHKDYYVLGMDIFKMVSLDLPKRNVNGREFLDEKLSAYKKLVQSSNIIDSESYIDMLFIMDDDDDDDDDDDGGDDGEAAYDIERPRPSKVYFKPHAISKKRKQLKTATRRVANGIERICTPNNHRINKYRKDMKSHIQMYSKTIRPQFISHSNNTVGRASSAEDASYPASSSGKISRPSIQASAMSRKVPNIHTAPSMYDVRIPNESFFRKEATPSSASNRQTTTSSSGQIVILTSPVELPPVVDMSGPISPELVNVNIENPADILAMGEHKDAGVEDDESEGRVSRASYSSSSIFGAK